MLFNVVTCTDYSGATCSLMLLLVLTTQELHALVVTCTDYSGATCSLMLLLVLTTRKLHAL